MNANIINRIETIRGKKFSQEEITRLRDAGESLNLRDDAVWALLAAMEYQRIFYEALPDKIATASKNILKRVSATADKEINAAQARLTDSVVEQAKRLSVKIQYATILPMALTALLCLLAYGSLLLWAGFCIGTAQTVPFTIWLQMPSGFLIGGLCLVGGVFCGVVAARRFSVADRKWYKETAVSLSFSVVGGVLFFLYPLCVVKNLKQRAKPTLSRFM